MCTLALTGFLRGQRFVLDLPESGLGFNGH